MCTRVLGDAVGHDPEGIMAKRLCYDDAILELRKKYGMGADNTGTDVIKYDVDRAETHFVQEGTGNNIYLCG